ncbi:meiotic recombination protein mre11 [Grosmannia clavigera kw1407]|uniref:Meiotic recombination protein mre11 n=1 Tax=Grosmannia clavigera (strain kw1407 / UAMH 11150) TaxID=655863 RepID=F0X8Q5_GROCL|nr:meiotic recombination protein mre11 [Grosmannia clavigera kw1407]EFX05556.1 meiotic recombination protein mre11 [Grosmannia clavigera kw1407]
MPGNSDPNTIRILVSTDNHVGFEERDPIRKDDSWKTFDEIMNLARTEDVDMVLLGGDLFHDNKPSRKSMYQVMRSLRQNCLGMKPCELEFLSDAAEIFEGAFGHVNYEDPDINIAIPVFSIHGNHDDPSGDGHYCSLDLLQVAGLVNYFGRVPEADNIKVKPLLLQKGGTKLALFGMGNVRDERMFRTFRDHKVSFYRPNQQADNFFNLMVVHQNHHAHTATSYLPENFLPDWLDLVMWGHEHECLIDPTKNPETGFHVMQPGSSVATSLIPGEAVTKHVAILTITGKEFAVQKIPLKTVRPFVTRELILANEKKFKDLAKKKDNRAELTRRLMAVVEEMIEEANAEYFALHDRDETEEDPPLPLIRLKIEYTAPEGGNFDCENPQRFSNRFAGKVANVNDVVYFHRKKTGVSGRNKTDLTLPEINGAEEGADFNAIKVEALVQEYLAAQSLKILPQGEFGDAVNQFVNKDDKHAMDTFVSGSLANQLRDLLALGAEDDDLDGAMQKIRDERERQFQAGLVKNGPKRQYKPRPDDWDSDMEGHWENNTDALISSAASVPQSAASRQGGNTGAQPSTNQNDEDSSMDDFDSVQPVAKSTAARRTAATRTTKAVAPRQPAAAKRTSAPKRAAGRKKGPFEDSDDSNEDEVTIEDEAQDNEQSQTARRSRAAPARPAGRMRQTTLQLSQPAPRQQRPSRKTTQQTQQSLELSDDEISDDDDFEPAPTTRDTMGVIRKKTAVRGGEGGVNNAHQPATHPYRVIEQNSFPIFDKEWGADEELLLIEGAEIYGLGSWADIADHIGGYRHKDEVRDHYLQAYVESSKFPLPERCSPQDMQLANEVPREEFQARKKRRIEERREAAKNTPALQPKTKPTASVPSCHEIQGYMPGRLEFETEYANEAEEAVQLMQFDPGDGINSRTGELEPEMDLKLTVMRIYNCRLTQRVERKKVIFEHNLLDYRENNKLEKKRTKDERELVNKAKPFARMMNHDDFKKFSEGLTYELFLRQAISQLQEWRSVRIGDLESGLKYELEKTQRLQKAIPLGSMDRERLATAQRNKQPPAPEPPSGAARLLAPDLKGLGADLEGGAAAMAAAAVNDDAVANGDVKPVINGNGYADAASVTSNGIGTPNGFGNGTGSGSLANGSSFINGSGIGVKKEKIVPQPIAGVQPLTLTQDNAADLQLLTPEEVELCQVTRIQPKPYLMIKEQILKEALKGNGMLRKKQAKEICKLDSQKGSRIFEFFVNSGWIGKA